MVVSECSGCGLTFMADEGAARCAGCEASRDPLRCVECNTTLLVPVPKGLCGICDEDWTEHLAAAA